MSRTRPGHPSQTQTSANHTLATFEALACEAQPRTFGTTTKGNISRAQHVRSLQLTFPLHPHHGYPKVSVGASRVRNLVTRRASRLTLGDCEMASLALLTIGLPFE